MIETALAFGLVVSIVFSEVLGLAAGGMVVPGYLALEIQHPVRLVSTFLCALLTWAVMLAVSRHMLIYGRRRTAATILVGFLMRYVMQGALSVYLPQMEGTADIIGFIIPGLIAIWMARQGVIETISTGLMAASVIRLFLLLLIGWEVLP